MRAISSGGVEAGAGRPGLLSGRAAVWTAAAVIAVMFMGSTLLTPLYGLYKDHLGFSVLTLTLLYAVYVVGNLTALGFFGRLSDLVGRRPIALLALGLGIASAILFLMADRLAWLFVARALSGLAVGLGAGTATAWITELLPIPQKPAAAATATGSNFIGLALGPAVAGPLAQYAPWPLHLSFWVYLAALAAVALAVFASPETVEDPRGLDPAELRPRVGVPRDARASFLAPAITVFGTMALVGFFAALAPSVMRQELHIANLAVASLIVGGLFVVSAAVVFLTGRMPARTAMLSALGLFIPTLALLSAAQLMASLPVLLAGTALAGVAAALGYKGGLQVVTGIAPQDRRAEVTSTYYLCGFAGNALPVIGVGAITMAYGAKAASLTLAVAIGAFALAAIAWELLRSGGGGRG